MTCASGRSAACCSRPRPSPTLPCAPSPTRTVPVTLIDRLVDVPYDMVGVQNVQATSALVEHLAGHGHRCIALVAGPLGLVTPSERLAGHCRGLTRAGPLQDDALVSGDSTDAVHARRPPSFAGA